MWTKLQRAGETVIIVGLLVFVLGGETVPVVVTIGVGIALFLGSQFGKRYKS